MEMANPESWLISSSCSSLSSESSSVPVPLILVSSMKLLRLKSSWQGFKLADLFIFQEEMMMRMRIVRIRNGKEIQNNLRHVTRKMVRFFFCLLGYWKITFTKQLSK